MPGLCPSLCFSFSLRALPQSCGSVPVAVQTKGVDWLWEQSVCGALVCTSNHWFAFRIVGEVVLLDSLHCGPRRLGIRALAQLFDEYKFVFPVHASSIGHGHPEDSGHGQKVAPKPEILKIEQKSVSMQKMSTLINKTAPRLQMFTLRSALGKQSPLICKMKITFLMKNHNL